MKIKAIMFDRKTNGKHSKITGGKREELRFRFFRKKPMDRLARLSEPGKEEMV